MSDTLLASLLASLDVVVFERLPHSVFMQVTPSPGWFTHAFGSESQGRSITLAQAFPFLDPFLSDAEAFWSAGETGVLRSEAFTAPAPGGDVLLRAAATTAGRRPLLVLERLVGLADPRGVLQLARDKDLRHEQRERGLAVVRSQVKALVAAVDALPAGEPSGQARPSVEAVRAAAARLASAMNQLAPQDERPR
jgi:hypothetical protein